MARKSKLEGDRLMEFVTDRLNGMRLRECSVKYGLTQARLSQIFRKHVTSNTPEQLELDLNDPVA